MAGRSKNNGKKAKKNKKAKGQVRSLRGRRKSEGKSAKRIRSVPRVAGKSQKKKPLTVTALAPDHVNHPPHYNQGRIEVIEFIEDQNLGFHLGNSVKYICRAGKKPGTDEVVDLEKAIWYLRRRLELVRAARSNEPVRRPNEMPQERIRA